MTSIGVYTHAPSNDEIFYVGKGTPMRAKFLNRKDGKIQSLEQKCSREKLKVGVNVKIRKKNSMWVMPTYNRPRECARVLAQISNLGGHKEPLVIFLNGLDRTSEYQELLSKYPKDNLRLMAHDRNIGLCGALRMAFYRYPTEKFYGLIHDDEYPLTENWEARLIDTAGDWDLAHGNNRWTSHQKPHGILTLGGNLVRCVGNWAPKGLWHWYLDAYWENIAKRCGAYHQCKDVLIEERHYRNKLTEKDPTHEAGEALAREDQEFFERWLRDLSSEGFLSICERVKKQKQGTSD